MSVNYNNTRKFKACPIMTVAQSKDKKGYKRFIQKNDLFDKTNIPYRPLKIYSQ